MTALLADIQPGDEIIMPSYTFVSTANAFVLRGAVPVFVDIRPDTLNIDEQKIEQAITSHTKAIVAVHYAGVACEMDIIMSLAAHYQLLVIEDAAQSIMSSYKGKALGSIGHFGALSFHETKNIISGEGGALLINNPSFIERVEIIREKGTNRSQFFREEVDKYTWCDIGSSFLPGELVAAFLWAQMEEADAITKKRIKAWNRYHELLYSLEQAGYLKRPTIPQECDHNAHMYYVIVDGLKKRTALLKHLKHYGINCVFHYVPLHSSPAGKKYGRPSGSLELTEHIADSLFRLPLWFGLSKDQIGQVCNAIYAFFK